MEFSSEIEKGATHPKVVVQTKDVNFCQKPPFVYLMQTISIHFGESNLMKALVFIKQEAKYFPRV